MPRHGIFVAERLRHLLRTGVVETTVCAPVPWFPLTSRKFGTYAAFARVPREGACEGRTVLHPRYPLIPKFGMTAAPTLLAAASYRALRRWFGKLDEFDLIDAHYFYPDGVAACLLGRWLGKPVVITGRGTDLNLIPQYRLARRQIRAAANNAAALITVSEALRQRLIELGAPPHKVTTLRNGVDLEKFRPLDRNALRHELGFDGPTLLSVGNLIELKGHHVAIEGLNLLPGFDLVIAGGGPDEAALKAQVRSLGLDKRVRFVGSLTHADLVRYYNAVDCLVLCSSREGMANVLLEAIACGTPAVATGICGTPEVIADDVAGVLMKDRNASEFAEAVNRLFAQLPDRRATRRYAEKFSWSETTEGQLEIFRHILGNSTT